VTDALGNTGTGSITIAPDSTVAPAQPSLFTTKTTFVYKGDNNVAYSVQNYPGVTYVWTYSGTGATINGTGNSVTVSYASNATSGTLSVTANNACGTSTARTLPITVNDLLVVPTTNYDYSFVTVGCNRLDYLDTAYTAADPDYFAGPSTANVYQLKRLFTEISHMNPLPKYLFMTGDIVMGYIKDTVALARQLTEWRKIYESHPLSQMATQLVVVPGNHETQDKAAGKKSFVAAERTFVRIMAPYIRGNNGPGVGGADNLATDQSQLSYSFNFGGDHFIVLNTDPVGADGTVSYKWLANDIQTARANNARHIFAFGHKPAYSSPLTPAGGLDAAATLAKRDSLWKYLEDYNAEAMFSAHEHLFDTINPHKGSTWQVVAGNGGSRVEPVWKGAGKQYYGYTLVNLYSDRKVNVMGLGRNTDMSDVVGSPFTINEDANPTTERCNFNICLTTKSTTTVTASNSYTWNGTTYTNSGTYTKTLVNAGGCDSIAKLILTLNKDNQIPTVAITSPTSPASFNAGGSITVNVSANDSLGRVTKVELFVDGALFATDSIAPYAFSGNNVEAGTYKVVAKATDDSSTSALSDTLIVTVNACNGSGTITGEGYTNISGSQLADLTSNAAFPNNPTIIASLSSFEYSNVTDNYGARVRGYICAPVTGDYRFHIAADDQAALWVSTDENPLNKVMVAYTETATGFREWNKFSSQTSAPIHLVKGARYYIESQHKEAVGPDHLSVGWTAPGGYFEAPIPGSRLSPIGSVFPSAANVVGSGAFADAMANATTGVQVLSVKALPNPTTSYFTLNLKSNSQQAVRMVIVDVMGRIMENRSNVPANGTLQVGEKLPAGVYFVELTQGSHKERLKLVKL
jgi:hypothetical protein